jgi:hypothetical protein
MELCRFFFAMLVPLTLGATSCDFQEEEPMAITVVDEETSKPIEDAYVIVQWSGQFRYAISRVGECYHAEWAKTDRDGVARIPGWKADVSRSNESWFTKVFWREVEPSEGYMVTIVRYGYLYHIGPYGYVPYPFDPYKSASKISIKRTEDTDEARAKGLGDPRFGCREDHRDAEQIASLNREMERMLVAVPDTPTQRALLNQVRDHARYFEGWVAFRQGRRQAPLEYGE